MYEMASSRVPFDADNLMGILTKHLYEEPVKPHELPPPVDVPVSLEAIIMKCLAKKADVRYQSMQEVLADLELAEQGLTPSAVVEGVRRASATGTGLKAGSGSAIQVDVGEVALPKKGNTGIIVGAVAAVVLLGGGAIVALSGGDKAAIKQEPAPAPAAAKAAPIEPPPAPAPAEPAPAAAPAEELVQVNLSTTPEGAEVYNDGALVGTAPLQIPRPKRGEPALDLTIKLEGHKERSLKVNAFTQTQLTLELEKEKEKERRRSGGGSSAKPAEPSKPQAEEEKKPSRPKPASPQTEVLDPWS
jgi:serine/threonine-protein kinase